MPKSPKIIQNVAQQIKDKYQPEKIILFGSYAWGRPGPDSDVDLFIIKKRRKRKVDRERELRKLLFGNDLPPMDFLIYTPKELKKRIFIKDLFIQEILSRGKLLYDK